LKPGGVVVGARDGRTSGRNITTQFDGKPIQNLYACICALRGKRPGDVVAVKVTRDGKPLEVTVTLSRRQ
jgi:S1-C subfamily serine protease